MDDTPPQVGGGPHPGRASLAGPTAEEASLADILVVCTANVARSPLLAALLQGEADRRLGAGTLVVASAGTHAAFGHPATEGSRRVAEAWGLSLAEHRSQPLTYVDLDGPALVVTMTRRQERAITLRRPEAGERTFPLRVVVPTVERLRAEGTVASLDTDGQAPRQRVEAAVAAMAAQRPRPRLRRNNDVPDPVAGGRAAYDRLGQELRAAGDLLADALFGPPG